MHKLSLSLSLPLSFSLSFSSRTTNQPTNQPILCTQFLRWLCSSLSLDRGNTITEDERAALHSLLSSHSGNGSTNTSTSTTSTGTLLAGDALDAEVSIMERALETEGGMSTDELRQDNAALREQLESSKNQFATLRAQRDTMVSHVAQGHDRVARVQAATDFGMVEHDEARTMLRQQGSALDTLLAELSDEIANLAVVHAGQ